MAVGLVLAHDLSGTSGHKHRDSEEAWVAGSFLVLILVLLLCCGMSGYGMSGCGDWCGRGGSEPPPCLGSSLGSPPPRDEERDRVPPWRCIDLFGVLSIGPHVTSPRPLGAGK